MKALTIRYVVKGTTDPEEAIERAKAGLHRQRYRNVTVEQTRPFDDHDLISVYAVADHDMKRPPGLLRGMRAVVLVEDREPGTPEPELDLRAHGVG